MLILVYQFSCVIFLALLHPTIAGILFQLNCVLTSDRKQFINQVMMRKCKRYLNENTCSKNNYAVSTLFFKRFSNNGNILTGKDRNEETTVSASQAFWLQILAPLTTTTQARCLKFSPDSSRVLSPALLIASSQQPTIIPQFRCRIFLYDL